MKVKVSAPGKLLLLGEHAVVYNRPCLVTAVNHRLSVELTKKNNKILEIIAPDLNLKDYKKDLSQLGKGDIPKAVQFVEMAVKNFQEKYGLEFGLRITTKSQFKVKFGFGSSSASAVCAIRGLAEITGINLSKREIFDLSYKTVLDVQGVGSGFDVAAATYGGTLYFVTGGKEIKPLNLKQIPLVVSYSGIKGDTAIIVKDLAKRREKNSAMFDDIFNTITELVEQGKNNLENQDWQSLGDLMRINHGLLVQLGVSTDTLDNLCTAALSAGAYGAKLSGAGGGDCMIALVNDETRKSVEQAIVAIGGELINIQTSAPGVQLEL